MNDIDKIKAFVFEMNPLDGLNCPASNEEFLKYSAGFQDFKSAMQVWLDKTFPEPVLHNATEDIQ